MKSNTLNGPVSGEQVRVRYFRFHALRHGTATFMEQSGINISSIQKLLGHESRQWIIDSVESKYKGFRDLIDYKELATRLTIEDLLNRETGDYTGIPATPDRYRQKWISVKTPVKNLYLTGTDAAFMGIEGAMMGGVATAAYLQDLYSKYKGRGMMKIFEAANIGFMKSMKLMIFQK